MLRDYNNIIIKCIPVFRNTIVGYMLLSNIIIVCLIPVHSGRYTVVGIYSFIYYI